MNQVYVGKEGTKCDGNIFGYSYYMHIMTTGAGIPSTKDDGYF